jgi:hypothetical protein
MIDTRVDSRKEINRSNKMIDAIFSWKKYFFTQDIDFSTFFQKGSKIAGFTNLLKNKISKYLTF